MKLILKSSALLIVLCSLASCSSPTGRLATSTVDPAGAPPAPNQPTGTVTISDGSGSVRVAPSPVPSSAPGNHWLQISHPTQPAPETVMRARFDSFHGPGHYG